MLVESVPCLQDPWDTYFWKLPVLPAPHTPWHPDSQDYAPVEGSGSGGLRQAQSCCQDLFSVRVSLLAPGLATTSGGRAMAWT